MQIEDGAGTGRNAKVDSENRLHTEAVTLSAERHVNQEEGESYNVVFTASPTGVDPAIFYIKNTADIDMIVEGVWWRTVAAEIVSYKLGDTGTPVAGTTVTPANLNASSGKIADATTEYGVDITGLSGGSVVQTIYLPAGDESKFYNCEQGVIVPQNQTFTIYSAASGTLNGTVVINFHSVE